MSGMGSMFGYVTAEDKQRWEAQRAAKQEAGAVRSSIKAFSNSMMQFSQQNIMAKLQAEHRIASQQAFDETHERTTTVSDGHGGEKEIIEKVNYEPRKFNENGTEEAFEMGD